MNHSHSIQSLFPRIYQSIDRNIYREAHRLNFDELDEYIDSEYYYPEGGELCVIKKICKNDITDDNREKVIEIINISYENEGHDDMIDILNKLRNDQLMYYYVTICCWDILLRIRQSRLSQMNNVAPSQ